MGAFMKRYVWLIITTLLIGCNTKYEPMTRQGYEGIDIGISSKVVEKRFGKPYKIYSKGGNGEVYEYIEKIPEGTQVIEQRHYYIIIKKGKVVSKHTKFSNPPALERDLEDFYY